MTRSAPPPIGAMLAEAARRLAAGDRRGAEALCRRAINEAPQAAEAHYLLGEVALAGGDAQAALAHLERAGALKPGFGRAAAARARALEGAGKSDEAVVAAESAAEIADDPYSWDTIGVVFTRAGRHDRAVKMYAQAAKGARSAGYWYNYAAALQFLGRFDEARAAYREALKLNERHALAWAGLVQITPQTPERNELPRLMRIAQQVRRDRTMIHRIGHALAKAHDDLGDAAGAMQWLDVAKAGWRDSYDAGADEERFSAAAQSASLPLSGGHGDEQPIFVVGMPRTGTTLVERILSGHSRISSVGETQHFAAAMRRVSGAADEGLISGAAIEAGAKADPAAIGRNYCRAVRATLGVEGRFVEKQPFNALLVPLILRALPKARVIMLRRHPADAVLSNYRQDFAQAGGLLDYTFDLKATARYVARFEGLARIYADLLPEDRYCEVRYEDVVADLEKEARRLLDFCNLDFEEACLRFQDNASPVATASAAQVRRPLYASSVGRWRLYRPAIDPALEALVEAGVLDAQDLKR